MTVRLPTVKSDDLILSSPSFINIFNILPNNSISSPLLEFYHALQKERSLIFYTDGSHKFISSPPTSYLSSAFCLVHDSLNITFSAAVPAIWANSTNAEIFALLLVLLISPSSSSISVHTDSLALIHTYNYIVRTNAIQYPSLMFKVPFYIFWSIIFKVIEERQITISLLKVTAHSNDPYNDKADQLAKSSLLSPPLSLSLNHIPFVNYIPTFNNMPIHRLLRSFLKDYTNTRHFSDYYHLKRNTKYQHLQVNWLLTFHFIQSGSASITSFTETRNRSRKLKFLLEQLLTVQFMKATQPLLYLSL